MLTFDDCLKLCCLSEDEIDAIATAEAHAQQLKATLRHFVATHPESPTRRRKVG